MTESEIVQGPQHSTARSPAPKHPLRLLVKRLSLLCLTMYLLSLALWLTGNLRQFLDSTQSLLLSFLSWDALLLALFSLLGLLTVFVFPLPSPPAPATSTPLRRLPGLLGYLFLLLLGLLGALFGSSILTLAAGLH